MEKRARYYLFIGDVIKLKKDQEIHLFETLYLKRANAIQIKRIKEFIEPYIGIAVPNFKINQYETYPKPNKEKGAYSHIRISNPNHWNYIVIEHDQDGHINEQMQQILYLSSLCLTVVFEAIIGHNHLVAATLPYMKRKNLSISTMMNPFLLAKRKFLRKM